MTGQELVNFTAKWCRLYDQANQAVLTNKYLVEADLLEYVDARYREHVVPRLKRNNPTFYEKTYRLPNWEATGTAHASSSTGSTFVAASAIFTPAMIGATLYNSTDSDSRTIIGYTNTSTVTLDEAINDSWDGDTVYVLSGRVGFTGSMAEAIELTYLAIKQFSDDQYPRTLVEADFSVLNDFEYEDTLSYSTYDPTVFVSTEEAVDGSMYTAINFRPIPETPIADSVILKATVHPDALTLLTEPRLPAGNHQFLSFGAAADAGLALGLKTGDVDRLEQRFNEGLQRLLATYRPRRKMRLKPYRNRAEAGNRFRRQRSLDIRIP